MEFPPTRVTITLTDNEWLAVAAALRTMDDDLLEDEGVLPGVAQHLESAWEVIEAEVSETFGEDWPLLVTTQERLEEEEFWTEEDGV